jgi:alcohol dehydrogenase class IV
MFAAISDVWSLRALELVSKWLPIAVENPSNDEARGQTM